MSLNTPLCNTQFIKIYYCFSLSPWMDGFYKRMCYRQCHSFTMESLWYLQEKQSKYSVYICFFRFFIKEYARKMCIFYIKDRQGRFLYLLSKRFPAENHCSCNIQSVTLENVILSTIYCCFTLDLFGIQLALPWRIKPSTI